MSIVAMLRGGPYDGDLIMLSGPADHICPAQPRLYYTDVELSVGGVSVGRAYNVEVALLTPPFYARRGPVTEARTTYQYDYTPEPPGARPKMATGEEPKCRAP